MPFEGVDDPKLPDHVQELGEKKREQWVGAWNGAYDDCVAEGGKPAQCEGRAYAIANSTLSKASMVAGVGSLGGYAVDRANGLQKQQEGASTAFEQILEPVRAIMDAIMDDLVMEGSITHAEREIVQAGFEQLVPLWMNFIDERATYILERPANTLVEPDTDERIRVGKVGARNSAVDFRRIQEIHDLTAKLGARCDRKNTGDVYTIIKPGKSQPVKSLGQNRIGQYGILFGNRQQTDLAGEYFTIKTAELEAIFEQMGRIPVLYQHAMDDNLKTSVVGTIDTMQRDDMGLWVEAQLDLRHEYLQAIRDLIEDGKLHWSSGTLPGARKVAKSGEILRWPIVELSLTPTPAEFRMLDVPIADVQRHYKAIGLDISQLQASQAANADDAKATVMKAAIEAGIAELDRLEAGAW